LFIKKRAKKQGLLLRVCVHRYIRMNTALHMYVHNGYMSDVHVIPGLILFYVNNSNYTDS